MPQIDLTAYPIKEVLPLLIRDKTTKENIIFAEDPETQGGQKCCPAAGQDKGKRRGHDPCLGDQ